MPESYSKAFSNPDGYIWLFDKWEQASRPLTPKNALVVGQLYRQPVHMENRFDSSLEDFFAKTADNEWPFLREAIKRREILNQGPWGALVEFICGQLVRVPLSMNSVIELLQDEVFTASNAVGSLPDSLLKLHNEITGAHASEMRDLVESGVVSLKIDPHRSISSMPFLVRNVPIFQEGFSFGIPKFLHNETNLDFISSDNPVVFHAGRHGIAPVRPYGAPSDQRFAFYFPISPRLMLVNSSFNSKRSMHCLVKDSSKVSELNRTIARFAYRFVFSNSKELSEGYGKRFSNICPRPDHKTSQIFDGHVYRIGYKFGPPVKLVNSWDYDFQ